MTATSITTKLAKVRRAAPDGWTDDQLRHLIHGVGGSPRRASRLLKLDDLSIAEAFRDSYAADIAADVPHITAVQSAQGRYLAMFQPSVGHDTEPEEADEEDADRAPVATPTRRQRLLVALAAQVAQVAHA